MFDFVVAFVVAFVVNFLFTVVVAFVVSFVFVFVVAFLVTFVVDFLFAFVVAARVAGRCAISRVRKTLRCRYRGTILSRNKCLCLITRCSASNWEELQPAFDHIFESMCYPRRKQN